MKGRLGVLITMGTLGDPLAVQQSDLEEIDALNSTNVVEEIVPDMELLSA